MRALKISGIVLLILMVIPLIAVSFFGGPIARAVVNSLSKKLPTEITVSEYDVAFWRSFPSLSVNLQDVKVRGSDGSDLLMAEQLSCLLDLGSLFGKIRVEEIAISDGQLNLITDVDGNTNYQLAGYTPVGEEVPEGAPTEFAIADAQLNGVEFTYRDAQLQIDVAGNVDRATFSGDFGAKNYLLAAEGLLDVYHLDQEGIRYLNETQLRLESKTNINNEASEYTLAPLRIESGDLEMSVVGALTSTKDGLFTNLRLESESGSLEDVLALIPPAYAGTLNELETRGKLSLSGSITGPWTQRKYPKMDGRLTFSDGRVGSPRINIGARDLDLKARFAYLDGPTGGVQSFAIEELKGTFRNQPFSMKLSIENLDDPRIDFSADGALPLATLPAIMGEGPVTDGDGYVRIQGLRLAGRYEDMLRPRRMGQVAASGRLTFDDGELTVNERTLSFPSGTLELRDNEMELTDLAFEGPGTEISFTGKATNLIPVLFADSLNTNDAELNFDARLTGESFDIDELLKLAGPTEEEQEIAEAAGTTDSLRAKTMVRRAQITDLLRGRFDAEVEEWNYGEIEGEDFQGQLIFTPRQLDVRGITDAMDGQLKVDGEVYFQELQRVEGRISGIQIDVNQFFAQGENFGQEVLVADNIEGKMDAKLWIQAYFDEKGVLDYEKLKVLAGIDISDGELNDFEMLENFAFALKAGDLDKVRFTRLQNFFEITDETLYIPVMFVQTSALNLELSGSHTFNNYLDYFIKVNAGQAIANKIGRHNRNLDILPARRNGFFNLYYTVKGPLDSYAVDSNKRAVKNDFKRSEYRKNRVRRELAELFAEPIELVEAPVETEDEGGGE
ncbi:MAG: AsmA-like C-terminal region-containing protein [Lewinella sp.]